MLSQALWLLLLFVNNVLSRNPNDQVGANLDYGTFQNPSNAVRPRFRYWVPDASVNTDVVATDILAAADHGLGGVELLGYYWYGGENAGENGVPVDYTIYGWGSEPWSSRDVYF